MRSHRRLILVAVGCLCGASLPARAVVQLELRPASQSAFAGQSVAIELYAVANPSEPVGIIEAALEWDPAKLTLVGFSTSGAFGWSSAGFSSGGLNTTFSDGNALFRASVSTCTSGTATPSGLLVTTLLFTTGGAPPTSTMLNVKASVAGVPSRVWDKQVLFGCGGVLVPTSFGPDVTVNINACVSGLNCNDNDACTTDSCVGGSCDHAPNYNDLADCCDPSTGSVTPISDGNDCTLDSCNPLTGVVTHTDLASGSSCGSSIQDFCTNPDTCDGDGLCQPHNVADGAFCDDFDSCSQESSCLAGICVGSNPVANGTTCTDSQDCTTSSGSCTDGVCLATGNPCPSLTPYCVEDGSCGKDADCLSPATCVGGQCTNGFKCWGCLPEPQACLTSAECPPSKPCQNGFCINCGADVGCITRFCSPLTHECVTIQNDNLCFDASFCNGDEQCDLFGACQPANPPSANCPVNTVCNEADDNCVECLDSSNCPVGLFCDPSKFECVECLSNAHCSDGNECNGNETCNLTTGDCIPGTPVTCNQPNICTIDVCNPVSGLCEPRPAETVVCTITPDSCPAGFLCGPSMVCVPENQCTDSNGCTVNDSCTNGLCVGVPPSNPGPVNVNLGYPPSPPASFNVADFVDIRFNAVSTSGTRLLTSATGNLKWDPVKLTLVSPFFTDPCTTHPSDPLNCPVGPPRQYDWFSSGFISFFDMDNLNTSLTDGNAQYAALVSPEQPEAQVPTTGLWITTLKFQAIGSTTSAGTDIQLMRCTGPGGTFTRVAGTAGDQTGVLSNVNVKIKCTVAAHCNDSNPCTLDSCNGGTQFCEYTNVGNGTPCGNPTPTGECDQADQCLSGVCSANSMAAGTPCSSDGLQCTDDVCDGTGACGHPNKANGTTCDDTLYCTLNESCTAGFCGGGQARSCADAFNCTADSCNEAMDVCVNTPNDAICNNGQFCDGAETCSASVGCVDGIDVDCSTDGIACTENDFCNEALNVCDGVPNNDLCPMGEICVSQIGCVSGTCPPPILTAAGPRWIGITPQLPGSTMPQGLLVESTSWPCLSKYVGLPTLVDLDANQTIDASAAKLVDNPNNAAILTPAEWGGTVYITGEDITPTERIGGLIDERFYSVRADCGGGVLSAPVTVRMDRWGDCTNDDLANFADVQLTVAGFQGTYHLPPGANPGSLRVSVDMSGPTLCEPLIPLVINFTDINGIIQAFQGRTYASLVLDPLETNCDMPCPQQP